MAAGLVDGIDDSLRAAHCLWRVALMATRGRLDWASGRFAIGRYCALHVSAGNALTVTIVWFILLAPRRGEGHKRLDPEQRAKRAGHIAMRPRSRLCLKPVKVAISAHSGCDRFCGTASGLALRESELTPPRPLLSASGQA
jgi:hypothetical protein